MITSFENKTVIITGASAGVGAACARAFANLKANLVLIARGEPALQTITNELSPRTKVLAVALDVGDLNACEDLFERVQREFGAIHVLVNNAGCHNRGKVESVSREDLTKMVDINLSAPIALCHMVLPYLRQVDAAAIVNVASLAGRIPVANSATYSASKFGLRAFSYALNKELSDSQIHVGIVSPGPIDTGFIMDEIDDVTDITFSQGMSTAEQVALAIVDVAAARKKEIAMPFVSGLMTTLGYVFPAINRAMAPMLEKKGRKAKNRYRNRNQQA